MGVALIVYGGGGRKKTLSCQNKVENFLEIKFFCATFWLHSAPNKRKDHLLRLFSKILSSRCGEAEGIFVLQQN